MINGNVLPYRYRIKIFYDYMLIEIDGNMFTKEISKESFSGKVYNFLFLNYKASHSRIIMYIYQSNITLNSLWAYCISFLE